MLRLLALPRNAATAHDVSCRHARHVEGPTVACGSARRRGDRRAVISSRCCGSLLLKAGLAKVIANQDTKKVSVFDELSAAEEEAKAKNLGVHDSGGEVRKVVYSTDDGFDTEKEEESPSRQYRLG